MSASIYFWRRTDVEGLERLELVVEPQGVRATSTAICLEAGGFRLDHRWQLNADWCCATSTFSSGCSYLPDTETALHWPTCSCQGGSHTSGAVMPAEMDAKAASPA